MMKVDMDAAVAHLLKNTTNFDARPTLKVLRNLPQLRRTDPAALAALAARHLEPSQAARMREILSLPSVEAEQGEQSPEIDAFVHLVALTWTLHDGKAEHSVSPEKALQFAWYALKHLAQYNRRSLDHLMAKIWFYYLRAVELCGQALHDPDLYSSMMAALRTAALCHDFETHGMLVVLLLRTLLATHRVNMAASLVSKTAFNENKASNALGARYYYYLARISAIELDYGTAFEQITAAIRKVPHTPAATGFVQSAHKLSVLVELLTGDVPPRKVFGSKEQPELLGPLRPYLALAKAVRAGDIQLFQQALANHGDALKADGNLTLARRLRQNVIKTGLRVISLTYSRISLKDVCVKLSLDSEESAEYVVAKAIRDGVLDAEINHQQGFMQSLELRNVYATKEPQRAFHERICFCMSLHDENMKALRYLSSDHSGDLKDVQEALEREKELVTEIQENTDLEEEEEFDF